MKKSLALLLTFCLSVCPVVTVLGGEYEPFEGSITISGQHIFAGNGIKLDGRVYMPVRELAEELGKDVSWQESYEIVEITDTKTPIEDYEEYKRFQFPLLAALPQDEIYLYAVKPEGAIFLGKDGVCFLDEFTVATTYQKPQMKKMDLNQDGRQEVVLSVTQENNIDTYRQALFVISDTVENDMVSYVPYGYNPVDYLNQLEETLQNVYRQEERKLVLQIGQEEYACDLTEYLSEDEKVSNLCYGDYVYFTPLEDKVTAAFLLGVQKEGEVEPYYVGTLEGEVSFDEKMGFSLENIQFVSKDKENYKQIAVDLIQKDIDKEFMFMGGYFSISDETRETENQYAPYYPVKDEKYHSLADIYQALEDTYTTEEKINGFWKYLEIEENPLYKEIDGQLYVNDLVGGKGMPLQLDEDSLTAYPIHENQAAVYVPYTVFIDGFEPGVIRTTMTKTERGWRLDEGMYDCWYKMDV